MPFPGAPVAGLARPRRTLLVPGWVLPVMSLFGRLALLFLGVPVLELLLLIQMGRWVGVWPTVALVLVTGFAGATLARLEGLRVLIQIQAALARGQLPGRALLDGLAVLLGGALLLTPGILTDLVGLSFLFPLTRGFLLGRIRRSLERHLREGAVRVTYFAGFPGARSPGWESPDRTGEIVVEPSDTQDHGG